MTGKHPKKEPITSGQFDTVTLQLIQTCFYSYREHFYAYTCRLVKNEAIAKDIVSDAFLACLNYGYQCRTIDELRGRLYTICRNKAFNYNKYGSGFKNKREQNVYDPATLQQLPDINDQLMCDELNKEALTKVRDAVKQLSDQQRSVIELMFFEAQTTGEVANKLNLPDAHIRSIKAKAITRLRQFLKGRFLSLA